MLLTRNLLTNGYVTTSDYLFWVYLISKWEKLVFTFISYMMAGSRRGLVAPQNIFLETVLRRFSTPRKF